MNDAPVLGEATDHESLVCLLAARKEQLGISNELLDDVALLSSGHVSKILGPRRERGLTSITIDALLGALAVRLVVVEDEAQALVMKGRWEGRDHRALRTPARVGAALVKRVRPLVLRELGRRAGKARWRGIDPKLRSRLMRELARLRWHANRDASEPSPQQETARP
jgi:hypothetical protein